MRTHIYTYVKHIRHPAGISEIGVWLPHAISVAS